MRKTIYQLDRPSKDPAAFGLQHQKLDDWATGGKMFSCGRALAATVRGKYHSHRLAAALRLGEVVDDEACGCGLRLLQPFALRARFLP